MDADQTPSEATDEAPEAPPEPQPAETPLTEIEITVAGHTVSVKAAAPMNEVGELAYDLFRATEDTARRMPIGFDVVGGQIERAEPYFPPGRPSEWPDEDRGGGRARLGRKHPKADAA